MPGKNQLTAIHSRRRFLKKTSLVSTLFILFNPIKKLYASGNKTKEADWRELIDYARWCPTVHNLQPHKIKIISPSEAELYYDPARLLPVEDPECVFVTVAMGVFIETLSIAAATYRKKILIIEVIEPIQTNRTANTLFARLQLTDTIESEPLGRELIKKRRTSRLHYNGHPLDNETISKLKKEALLFNHEFFNSSEKGLVDYIIKLNQETLFEDISSEADRKELDHLFRYSEAKAREHKDGLWARCMCVPGAMLQSVFRHPGLWTGFRQHILSAYYKKGFTGTATVCWFGGRFNNTSDWLNAGRMLARCWLITTQDDAYIHPFGSLITNVNAYKKINAKFTQPSEGKKIWMIFRAGYSSEPTRSFRLDTDDIIIS